jgi:hypothetical protein
MMEEGRSQRDGCKWIEVIIEGVSGHLPGPGERELERTERLIIV